MKTIESYDEIPYDSVPLTDTDVEYLAAIGRLFNVQTRDPGRCRVLELGCAAGGNLIPMAWRFPDSEFVGLDLSEAQVRQGQALIESMGLSNVILWHSDIADDTKALGMFDYIIAHGVYSWVPPNIQERILEICHDQLHPHGLAYVSYNTLPGWHTRAMLRDALLHHVRAETAPRRRLDKANEYLTQLDKMGGKSAEDQLMLKEVAFLRQAAPSYVYHEYLETINEPLLFSDFMARAGRHNLQYVADAEWGSGYYPSVERLRPAKSARSPARFLEGLADSENIIEREQYVDFLRHRRFRRTLLTHEGVAVRSEPERSQFDVLAYHADLRSDEEIDLGGDGPHAFVSPQGNVYTVSHPLTKAAVMFLASVYPSSAGFAEIQQTARSLVEEYGDPQWAGQLSRLRDEWLLLVSGQAVWPSLKPRRYPTEIPPAPRANELARAQATAGWNCTASVRHVGVELDHYAATLLLMMDGDRSYEQLVEAMEDYIRREGGWMGRKDVEEACERLMAIFLRNGLVVA